MFHSRNINNVYKIHEKAPGLVFANKKTLSFNEFHETNKTVTMHPRIFQILAKNKILLEIKTEISNFVEISKYVI